jgi:hypothetical protein
MKKRSLGSLVAWMLVAAVVPALADEPPTSPDPAAAPAAHGEHGEHSEHAATAKRPETAEVGAVYGNTLDAQGAMGAAEVLAKPELAGQVIKVSGSPNGVCSKMGCWLTFDAGEGRSLRVKMKDHAFFVPADIVGCQIVAEGTLTVREQGVEELRHLAEDAGKPAEEIAKIDTPVTVTELEATGVLVVAR